MLYAQRDKHGAIIALYARARKNAAEEVSIDDAEVQTFLGNRENTDQLRRFLDLSDTNLARVVEDLIELLVDKNLILFTELPRAAQDKLVTRRQARSNLQGDDALMVAQDDIL